MNRRSIRWRITAIAAAIALVVLALVAVIVVTVVGSELRQNLDRSLAQRADQIEAAALIDAGPALANSASQDRFAQVLDGDGVVLFSTDNVAGLPALADLPSDRQEARSRSDVPIEDDLYRVLVRRFDVVGGTQYVVVGENVDDVADSVRALELTLALAFPAAALVLAGSVWRLVGRTLRPVEDIRRQVAEVGLEDLDRRVPTPGTDDEIDRLATTMNDMLDRLENSAIRQQRFVADVSHELRTPLTRMRTSIEVDRADPAADLRGTLDSVLDDSIDMQQLVEDLLFLARHDAGSTPIRADLVDLDVVVFDEVQDLRATVSNGPQIDIGGVTAIGTVGDDRQLRRLVRIILANATRYASSRVDVSLEGGPIDVTITVTDDGPGIAPADRDRVFERFVRLDESRDRGRGGTGLGLAIASDIANVHGGTIRITDRPGGPGTRVVVTLPATNRRYADE
ncbi:MAG: HAMP domain-containing sensor histidine kinase [Ilumatobacteraceae bacterium]